MSVSEKIKDIANQVVTEQDNIYLLHQLKEKNFEIDKLNQIINSQALELGHLQLLIHNYQRLTLNLVIDQDKDNSKDFEEDEG